VDKYELGGNVCFIMVLQQVHILSMTSKGRLIKKSKIFNDYWSSKHFFTGISAGKGVCVNFPRSISAMK